MKSILPLLTALLLIPLGTSHAAEAPPTSKPNIVYILCDDLGYGDVHCLGGERSKIATPNMDRLAAGGMIFTDAHSSSSVCTPTRYGVLTGRYNWRSTLQGGVLGPYGETLIAEGRLTVAEMLRREGYATACIGKWHLGWDWPRKGQQVDFTQPIRQGPTTRGFDHFFGTDAPNYPPFCFIENDRTVGLPTAQLTEEQRRQRLRAGPVLPGWELEAILPTITGKACEFITKQAKGGKPFFLYFPLTSPHSPVVPSKEWKGRSGLDVRADFVMETDWAVGEVLAALDNAGIGKHTLVILTSDNGPTGGASRRLEKNNHDTTAGLRGAKTDIFEGGHRVPFIVRWPDRVQAGRHSAQTICLTDLMATSAEILGVTLPDNAGEDSVSILPALLGTDKAPLREFVVHHSINGSFAIRQGRWKLELCADSGGHSDPKPGSKEAKGLPDTQLYDLEADLAESKNVYAEHPEVVARLTKLLEKYIADGRSTPGTPQKNDAEIVVRKKDSKGKKQPLEE